MLASQRVSVVFDVGANVGQFGIELRKHVGFRGRIVSFEPLKSAHDALTRAAARDDSWEVAERVAIGAEQGTTTIHVSANSVSSSVLPMLSSHTSAAPGSAYERSERVSVVTLDSVALSRIRRDDIAFLKIDTQGYEAEVLKGAKQTLDRVAGLQLELSLVPLYAGQTLMPELLNAVQGIGFETWDFSPVFVDAKTGRVLQMDAIFFKPFA
jgi:FkbM family methyltransferase